MDEKELTDIREEILESRNINQSLLEDRIEAAEYFAENEKDEINKDGRTQRFIMAARMLTTLDSNDKKADFHPWLAKITMNGPNVTRHCNGVLVNARNLFYLIFFFKKKVT